MGTEPGVGKATRRTAHPRYSPPLNRDEDYLEKHLIQLNIRTPELSSDFKKKRLPTTNLKTSTWSRQGGWGMHRSQAGGLGQQGLSAGEQTTPAWHLAPHREAAGPSGAGQSQSGIY